VSRLVLVCALVTLAFGCASARARRAAPPPEPASATPAVLPVEQSSVADVAPDDEGRRPSPVEILGQAPEASVVQRFIGGAALEESNFDASRYLSAKAEGFELLIEGGVIGTVFLHGEGDEGFGEYAGPMPEGVEFALTREQVIERLGPPDHQGDMWDKWYAPAWSLHVEYYGGGMNMVTLMTAASDPNRAQ
jgi:hypothetical protein